MRGLAKEKVTEVTWGSNSATHVKAVGVGIGIGVGLAISVLCSTLGTLPDLSRKKPIALAENRHPVN
jgi:hypothetical protein